MVRLFGDVRGNVLCCRLDLSEGPQQAKGHFKDYEVGAICIVLWIVLCLWEGGVFQQFYWPKCFALLRAILVLVKNQDFPGVHTANVACGASTPPSRSNTP